jgi:ABC-type amino acid transport/signal transduction systems, periplasmic component/domain
MNKKRLSAIAILTVLLLSMFTGCSKGGSTASSGTSAKDKTYLIACDAKYAPFSFEDNGKYKGIDVELIDAISKIEGFKYELKPMDFSGIIPAIVSGQIDGSIAGMNITEKRKESVDFSDGYIKAASSIVVNKNNTDINKLDDLKGKTAAVKKGTTGAAFAEDNQQKYGLKISYYDDSPSMFKAVENGNADFLVEDYPVISYEIKVDPNSKLRVGVAEIGEVPYDGFAVKKGANQDLLKMFNEGLKKIKDNGIYDKIVGQYLPLDK